MQHGTINAPQMSAGAFGQSLHGLHEAIVGGPRPEPEIARLGHRFDAGVCELVNLAVRVEDLATRLGLAPPLPAAQDAAPTAPEPPPQIGTLSHLRDAADRLGLVADRLSMHLTRLERL